MLSSLHFKLSSFYNYFYMQDIINYFICMCVFYFRYSCLLYFFLDLFAVTIIDQLTASVCLWLLQLACSMYSEHIILFYFQILLLLVIVQRLFSQVLVRPKAHYLDSSLILCLFAPSELRLAVTSNLLCKNNLWQPKNNNNIFYPPQLTMHTFTDLGTIEMQCLAT